APVPLETAYTTTKHAVVGLSTSLRAEGAGLGVKVSVVCPGAIRTDILDSSGIMAGVKEGAGLPDMSAIKIMSPDDCARVILRGVERNKAIIPVTGFARVLWWLNRLNPNLPLLLFSKMVEVSRSARVES
ncbi:MAG: SDR family NAD(P)-dependent oxidoreductase, partial [bacterium]|nr:SDR family NAD(P)-dependent oxidoreductase [bacterium]